MMIWSPSIRNCPSIPTAPSGRAPGQQASWSSGLRRPDSVENGPADTAAGEKARIGCIDDSIHSHLDNIAVNDRKCHENPSLSEKANTYLYVRTLTRKCLLP